jgi:L-seryl-tRNA(Ser) seleniumtransferase
VLLGRKDLCQAAWLNSAPHHAFGRSMKVGKEEIMGMLAAVEAWYSRDHEAEWRQWESWLGTIAEAVSGISGVETQVLQPESLSNNAPRLRISWDTCGMGIGGSDVYDRMLQGEPRIILAGGRGTAQDCPGQTSESWVEVMPWMMAEGDDRVVAEQLGRLLSQPPRIARLERAAGTPAHVGGAWEVELSFVRGSGHHLLYLEQDGHHLSGRHRGRTLEGNLRGEIYGSEIEFRSSQPYEGTRVSFEFRGTVAGQSMSGTVELGEYGPAEWAGHRLNYASPA